jgi:TolB protein
MAAMLLCWLIALGSAAAQPAAGAGEAGTIAYVRADSGDEIRLIEPDGANDRQLWRHGRPDPNDVYNILSLAWRPDAAELAFASTHEFDCSIDEADIFVVAAGGGNARRITQSPSCAGLAGLPSGSVAVPVQNMSGDALTGFLYLQGAPAAQPIALAPGGSATVTFHGVADLGDELQAPALILPLDGGRELGLGSAADVQAGASVTASTFYLSGVATPGWSAGWPTWRSDSVRLAYVYGFSSLYAIDPAPAALEFGDLLAPHESMPDFADLLAWGPPARAGELLYAGNVAFDSEGVYLFTPGSGSGGVKLVSYEVYEQIRGLAWLPDGSGFIYSVIETEFYEPKRANLFLYSFATGQATRITDLADEYAGQLSVSPDGQQIVFERSAAHDGSAATDLWVVGRDGSGLRLLVHNGAHPSWSQSAPAAPSDMPNRAYLPLVRR